jgi:ribonuclease P protein component
VYQAQTRVFRCAAVVPVKVDKRAVARNKVRRTIYTTIQNELKNLPVLDVIFFVSKTENIEADISAAIKKLL